MAYTGWCDAILAEFERHRYRLPPEARHQSSPVLDTPHLFIALAELNGTTTTTLRA